MSVDDERFMQLALAEADAAPCHGDVPVGAIAVSRAGDVLGVAHNRREIDRDPCAHAELLALQAAARALGSWRLEGLTLYVTLEPCAMCAGACINARVSRVVWGCADDKAGAMGSLFVIGADPRLLHRIEIRGGVLRDECRARLRAFFAAKR